MEEAMEHILKNNKSLTIYIHIGKHKSGSTALQIWGDENRDLLLENGILFPEASFSMTSREFGLSVGHDFISKYVKKNKWNLFLKEIKEEINKKNTNCSKILLSHENILDPSSLKNSIKELKKQNDNITPTPSIKFIIIDRDNNAWKNSLYKEILSNGFGFETHEREKAIAPFLEKEEEVTHEIISFFGRESLTYLYFDDIKENITFHILNAIGVEIESSPPKKVNSSIPDEAIFFYRYMNNAISSESPREIGIIQRALRHAEIPVDVWKKIEENIKIQEVEMPKKTKKTLKNRIKRKISKIFNKKIDS